MAIVVKNTNYSGEVLETILTTASTGNELVSKGLIMVIPGVEKKISIPRLKTGKMLQKRKVNPTLEDSKGDFNYSEHSLDPKDFMAFTTFNPRAFEHIWRKWQPKGNLVFSQLPPEAQNALLDALSKQVQFELGWHYVNGEYGDTDEELMDGILTQAAKDPDCIIVDSEGTTMLGILKDIRAAIPKAIRENPNLRILMSVDDFDRYDDELTQREHKNSDETEMNRKRYKGITIETIAAWPDGIIVVTLCSPDADGNLFAAVNLQDDENVIQIDKYSNSSELYFFKLLMKADTNIGFGEEFVVFDGRKNPLFKTPEKSITANPTALVFTAAGESKEVVVTASGDYTVGAAPAGFTVNKTETGLTVTAAANEGEAARSGSIEVVLAEAPAKKAVITLNQPNA
nr:MAG TPA: major capsid protein [Caudoviricetes sp.]